LASDKPTAAFALSVIAGILITLRGGIVTMMGSFIGNRGGYGFGGMMNGYGYGYGMMRGLGIGFGFTGLLTVLFGIIVIISALMLHSHPYQHTTWGILIVIFSASSTFGMMTGLGIGLILGIVGGILAIVWKPPTQPASHS